MTDKNLPGENINVEAHDATAAEQVAAALGALAGGTTVAPRTRSRRAVSKATSPEAAKADAAKARAVKTDAAAADAAKAGTRKAGTAQADTAQHADVAQEVAPDAPAKAPARRSRARKPAGAPSASAVPAEAATPPEAAPVPETAATPVADAPAAAPRSRRRATSPRGGKQAAAAEVPSVAAPVAEVAPEPEPAQATTSSRVGGTSRLATTALLFQAPEPSGRSRRRRAEAPAGPPRHPSEDAPEALAEDEAEPTDAPFDEAIDAPVDEVDEAVAAPDLEDVVDAEDIEGLDESEGDHDADAAGRRRRRRGGRGRRGRSGTAREDDEHELHDDADGVVDEDAATEDDSVASEPAEGAPPAASARRRSGRRGGGRQPAVEPVAGAEEPDEGADEGDEPGTEGEGGGSASSRRRRRRRRSRDGGEDAPAQEPRPARTRARTDEVTALKGSTRLEAKRQRRREGRDAGRRRTVITESEFLARRESVERTMVVRETDGRVQIGIVEDGVLVEHYVSRTAANSGAPMAGNVYLGRVQNVLPSMEAAFVDIGKGRNAVLYAGEVNWDAAGLEGQPRRIEQALKSGDAVLVQVTKEPVGHKGARLTSQITLAGRYLVYVPGGGMTGISRKLPDTERARLKKILKEIVPDDAGVIVRTAAEGASDDELRQDVQRLQDQWTAIEKKVKSAAAPVLLQGEPDLAIRVVRDVFNDDFTSLVVQGEDAWHTVEDYVGAMAPDLAGKISRWTESRDLFAVHRIDEQLAKGMDRKVFLPSGGSLVIDRTEAMTVIDVNTGKFTGSGGTLEETVTRNNLEAAEEIVRQLRLRDIGGIIVIDFIDMVLESNRDLVLRRLIECLGRDRTKHQVAEVTSLGLVQMTRKRVGQGLLEAFSEPCPHCNGRGFLIHSEPVSTPAGEANDGMQDPEPRRSSRRKKATGTAGSSTPAVPVVPVLPEARAAVKATLATIAAAAAHAHEHDHDHDHDHDDAAGHDEGAHLDAPAEVESFEVEQSVGGFDVVQFDVESFDVVQFEVDEAEGDSAPGEDQPSA